MRTNLAFLVLGFILFISANCHTATEPGQAVQNDTIQRTLKDYYVSGSIIAKNIIADYNVVTSYSNGGPPINYHYPTYQWDFNDSITSIDTSSKIIFGKNVIPLLNLVTYYHYKLTLMNLPYVLQSDSTIKIQLLRIQDANRISSIYKVDSMLEYEHIGVGKGEYITTVYSWFYKECSDSTEIDIILKKK